MIASPLTTQLKHARAKVTLCPKLPPDLDTGGTPARFCHRRHAGAILTPAARRRDLDTGGTPVEMKGEIGYNRGVIVEKEKIQNDIL